MATSNCLNAHGGYLVVDSRHTSILLMVETELPILICTPEIALITIHQNSNVMISSTDLTNFEPQFLFCLENNLIWFPGSEGISRVLFMPEHVVHV